MAINDSLFSIVKQFITPDFIAKAGGLLAESPERAKPGLLAAIPTVLSGIIAKGSTAKGAGELIQTVKDDGYDMGVPANYTERLSKTEGDHYLHMGSSALSGIFGDKLGAIMSAFSDATGMKSSSTTKILGLVAPLVMGTLGSKVKGLDFNPAALMTMLSQEKPSLKGMVPADVGNALGLADDIETPPLETHEENTYRPQEPHLKPNEKKRTSSNVLPLALVALVALGGLWLLNRSANEPVAKVPAIEEPRREIAKTPEPEAPVEEQKGAQEVLSEKLSGILDVNSTTTLPHRVTIEGLNFNEGTSELIAGNELPGVITGIADSLKAHPSSVVRIEGYTDSTGDTRANQALSLQRAEVIKEKLVAAGVDSRQLKTAGMGSTQPIAPNDTSSGREQNRRTDIFVLQR